MKSLGVTSVELLPVHTFINDSHLLEKGLTNYWGYNTIGFFAPIRATPPTSPTACASSRRWWRASTTPGSRSSSTSSTTTPRKATSAGRPCRSRASTTPATTGCCRTRSATTSTTPAPATRSTCRHPRVIQMVTDSLRYWVQEMHVDGFRFDLGTILAREPNGFDEQSGFLKACSQDPVLAQRQADRRALGLRPRRLSGRRLPAGLGGVERQVPRHRARFLARRGPGRGARAAAVRLRRGCSTAMGAAPGPASISSPRMTASR